MGYDAVLVVAAVGMLMVTGARSGGPGFHGSEDHGNGGQQGKKDFTVHNHS